MTHIKRSAGVYAAQAWMRSRGDQGTAVFTAESMADQFGVVQGTYDAVPLPNIKVNMVRVSWRTSCNGQIVPILVARYRVFYTVLPHLQQLVHETYMTSPGS